MTGILLGMGNPLLDMTIRTNEETLRRYGLKANDAILSEGKHEELFQNIMNKTYGEAEYGAGGATLNSIRISQWLLQKSHSTSYFGSIGDDEAGERLKKECENKGLNFACQISNKHPTGRCASVITGDNRSLVADLGAACDLSDEIFSPAENWNLVKKARVIYIGGFALTSSVEAVMKLVNYATQSKIDSNTIFPVLAMNLSAPFLASYFIENNCHLLSHLDIIMGNDDEFRNLMRKMSEVVKNPSTPITENMSQQEIAKYMVNNPERPSSSLPQRIVVMTRGKDSTIIADGTENIQEFPIKPIEATEIKDTNACGDAFVGGFLAAWASGKTAENKNFKRATNWGNYAANTVIRFVGCNYPEKPEMNENEIYDDK